MSLPGSQLQLAASGPANAWLDINPEMSFFVGDYKRNLRHSELWEPMMSEQDMGFDREITFELDRYSDYVNRFDLQVYLPVLPAGMAYRDGGFNLMEWAEFSAGQNIIDKHHGEYMHQQARWLETIGKRLGPTEGYFENDEDRVAWSQTEGEIENYCKPLYIPFGFYMNRHLQQVLPIVVITQNIVRLKVKFRRFEDVVERVLPTFDQIFQGITDGAAAVAAGGAEWRTQPIRTANGMRPSMEGRLLVQYRAIPKEQRQELAKKTDTFLIEQVQYLNTEETSTDDGSVTLNMHDFNHLLHEVLVFVQTQAALDAKLYNDTVFRFYDPYTLRIRKTQAWTAFRQRHNNVPARVWLDNHLGGFYAFARAHNSICDVEKGDGVGALVYALQPDDWRPSGAVNITPIKYSHMDVKTLTHLPQGPYDVKGVVLSLNVISNGTTWDEARASMVKVYIPAGPKGNQPVELEMLVADFHPDNIAGPGNPEGLPVGTPTGPLASLSQATGVPVRVHIESIFDLSASAGAIPVGNVALRAFILFETDPGIAVTASNIRVDTEATLVTFEVVPRHPYDVSLDAPEPIVGGTARLYARSRNWLHVGGGRVSLAFSLQ